MTWTHQRFTRYFVSQPDLNLENHLSVSYMSYYHSFISTAVPIMSHINLMFH